MCPAGNRICYTPRGEEKDRSQWPADQLDGVGAHPFEVGACRGQHDDPHVRCRAQVHLIAGHHSRDLPATERNTSSSDGSITFSPLIGAPYSRKTASAPSSVEAVSEQRSVRSVPPAS